LDSLVNDYVEAVIAGKTTIALKAVEKLLSSGGDIMAFAKEILEEVRKRLLKSFDARLLTVAKVLEIKIRTLKYSVLPHLPLEIAAIELLSCQTSNDTFDILWGAQNHEFNFHYTGYTRQLLEAMISKYGFEIKEIVCKDRCIYLTAIKLKGEYV